MQNILTHQEKFISLFPEHWMNTSKEEQEISLKIYQLLAKKIHPNEAMLATELPYAAKQIEYVLEGLKSGVYRKEGNIIGFAGLTTHPMTHTITMNGITTYTWCALDALFIPQLLGEKTHVKSADPITKNPIELTIHGSQVNTAQADIAVSLIAPDADKLSEDVIGNFCHFVHFFETRETGEKWIAHHPNSYLVSLREALQIAHLFNRTRYNHFYQ